MNSGIILNALICLIIFISTFATSFFIFKKYCSNKIDCFLAGFWLFVSLTWLAVFIDLILYLYGRIDLNQIVNQYFVQTFIFAQLTLGIYYGVYRVTKKDKFSLFLFFIFIISSAVALYFMYLPEGLLFREGTYFSVEYIINPITWNIFQVMAGLGLLSLFIDLSRFLIVWAKEKRLVEIKYVLSSLAIFIYGIVGYFDDMGYDATWVMVLLRLFMVMSALIAYIAFSKKEEFSDIV